MADIVMHNTDILELPDPVLLRKELDDIGYVIVRNALTKEFIRSQRLTWINYLKNFSTRNKFVRGNLIYGEPNFDTHSSIPSWSMYRSFEFLWNPEKISKHVEVQEFRSRTT
jgi:hypothetical protein